MSRLVLDSIFLGSDPPTHTPKRVQWKHSQRGHTSPGQGNETVFETFSFSVFLYPEPMENLGEGDYGP